jgi:large subunit ribosomal protein L4
MATIDIKGVTGEVTGKAELSEIVFGIEPNVPVMHLVVRAQRNAWRQGTSNTRTRGQVRGGGRKPWRQKGTGRARQGTIRAPQWVGGGTVFGPHPRSYEIKVNRKEVKLATRSALAAKLADEQLTIVEDFSFEKPSTKAAVAAMKALGLEGRTTVVVPDDAIDTYLSFRNIPTVNVLPAQEINTYELLDNKNLVITVEALKIVEEVLA